MFIDSEADITVYGGGAGGGKTYGLLIDATRGVDNPGYGALIFRRTMKQVTDEGGIWDESTGLYPIVGATPNNSGRFWTFPSGATIGFAGLETENAKLDYQGSQICGLGFDELTHFTQGQFFYLLSRNRSKCGIKPRVRATTNPQPGWVKVLLAPWVDREFPDRAKSGEIRWFIRKHNKTIWVPEPPKREACTKGPGGEGCLTKGCLSCFPPEKSITFIHANVFDNRDLLKINPEYLSNLEAQDEVDRRRLLDGDWDVKPAHLVIDAFDEARNVVGWFEVDGRWPRAVGMDFGSLNAAEIIIREEMVDVVDPKTGDKHLEASGRLFVTHANWPGHPRSWKAIADGIREMADGTPTKGAGGNRTTEQGSRQAMRKEGIPVDEPNPRHANPDLQYQCVNNAFRDGDLFIFDTCIELIAMLNAFTRILSKDGEPTDEFKDTPYHLLAALRYIVTKLRPPLSRRVIKARIV